MPTKPTPESTTTAAVAEKQLPNIVAVDQPRYDLLDCDSINRRGRRLRVQLALACAALSAPRNDNWTREALEAALEIVANMHDEAYWLENLPDEIGNLPAPGLDEEDHMDDGTPICVLTKYFDARRREGGAR